MYRRSSHEPRYKQSTREREPRHAESNESSEDSSSSEEEEDSSDRWTEESEDTVDSEESQSLQESEESSPILYQTRSPIKFDNSDKFYLGPYLGVAKVQKKDQFTQKNLLSPFPSYLIPPIQRRESEGQYYRVSSVMPLTEERQNFQNVERSSTQVAKKRESHGENEDRLTKKSHDQSIKKLSSKHKPLRGSRASRMGQPEPLIKCDHRENVTEPPDVLTKPTVEAENFMKNSTTIPEEATVSSRKLKTSSRDTGSNQQTTKNCPEYITGVESRSKSKRKPVIGAAACEKNPKSRDSVLNKDIGNGELVRSRGKEVREKLMYVVEEEGKSATKIETDLFSLNEILAIKKDLIELSEFAKKLKKLKEMKKDSESDKSKGNPCHCQPAEELLRDVNKRIEALEARQEELEKKSQSSSRKGDHEIESKKMIYPKTPSTSPPKTPLRTKASAVTTIPSVPKTEVMVSRAEGFPYNSDIVNELMDIKTQLEKLEKKRMMKEVSKETAVEKEIIIPKTKEHAIAVFSSRTYILTTENFDKTKNEKEKSKKELTKENVANWLKNVSVERMDNDVSVFLSVDGAKREENFSEERKRMAEIKCKNCSQVSKQEDFENQEPQKNRALENPDREGDASLTYLMKDRITEEAIQCIEEKKSFNTSSEKLFAAMSKSSEEVGKSSPNECLPQLPPSSSIPRRPSANAARRSGSSGSIPSTILIKQQLKKLKSQLTRTKHRNEMNVVRSKSTQELSVISTFSKTEKTAHNRKVRSSAKGETQVFHSEKKHKEGKNEFIKRLEAQFLALARNLGKVDPSNTSYSYSELLASVNLETDQTAADEKNLQESVHKKQFIMYTATARGDEKRSRSQSRDRRRERRKELRSKEVEKKTPNPNSDYKEKIRKHHERTRKEAERKERIEKRTPRDKRKKPPKRHKHKCRHYHHHHHHHRPCVLIHPWHPSCNCKGQYIRAQIKPRELDETPFSEDKMLTSSNTEFSTSQYTQESSQSPAEPPPKRTYVPPPPPPPPVVKPLPREKCERISRRCGLLNESIDSGLLKKFFKNLSRCYPRLSNLELSACKNQCVVKKPKVIPECKIRKLESDEGYWYDKASEDLDESRSKSSPASEAFGQNNRQRHHRGGQHRRDRHSQYQDRNRREPHKEQLKEEPRQDKNQRVKEYRKEPHREHHRERHKHHNHHRREFQYQCLERSRHDATEPDHLENCTCVRVYLENQTQPKFSDFKPFEILADESKSDGSTSRTKKSSISRKNNFVLPKFKPQIYYVGNMTEERNFDHRNENYRNEIHRNEIHRNDIHRNEIHRPSPPLYDQKQHYMRNDRCVCDRCGNVHPRSLEYRHLLEGECPPKCCEIRRSRESLSKKGETFPFFSLFSHFCKSKSRKSDRHKLNEVCHMKHCHGAGLSRSRELVLHGHEGHITPEGHMGHMMHEGHPHPDHPHPDHLDHHRLLDSSRHCHCKEKFIRLETRLKEIERDILHNLRIRDDMEMERVREKERERERERERNTKGKSRKGKQDHMEDDRKKRGKSKKKKGKEFEPRETEHWRGVRPHETAAYYYTINTPSTAQSMGNCPSENVSSDSKSSLQFFCMNKKISEGLSSLHSFWKNLRNYKIKDGKGKVMCKMKRRSAIESDILIGDPSRSCHIPKGREVLVLSEEPNSFFNKCGKNKRREKPLPKNTSGREKHK